MSVSANLRAAWQLAWIASDGMQRSFSLRAARLLARSVSLGYATLLLIVALGATGRAVTDVVATHGLAWLSALPGGLAALGLASALAREHGAPGLADLARARGRDATQLGSAQALGGVLCLVRVLAGPALLLASLSIATSPSFTAAAARLLLLVGTAAYVLLFATLLGALAAFAARTAPARPGSLLLAIVAVPWLLAEAWPAVPNLPDTLERCLDLMVRLGAAT